MSIKAEVIVWLA